MLMTAWWQRRSGLRGKWQWASRWSSRLLYENNGVGASEKARALVKLCSKEFFDDPSLLVLLLRRILRGRVLEQSRVDGEGMGRETTKEREGEEEAQTVQGIHYDEQ